MSLSNMKSWILCLALVSLVVANQVQVGAARIIAILDPCKLSGNSAPGCGGGQNKQAPPQQANEYDRGAAQDKDANGLPGIPYLSTAQTKATVHVSSGSSGSSRDQSEDGDATTDNIDPADAKPVQRTLPNRQSARRSRRRKQAHLTELELETHVSQLRDENSSLLKRSTDINQKYKEAAVKNRVLKTDVETMRAKMKMAEESIKRIARLNPMFHAMLELSTMNLPSDSSADGAVPVQDDPNHHFFQPPSDDPLSTQDPIVNNGLADISSADNMQPNPEAAAVAGNKIG
ncbi:hypothetical protein EZV62_027395 [Acer yangbiense]|uniref:BZIP domain-containing protein n=1 Tax=Acer yangbiense TaxID=1000413 RepID=A0A5C7GTK6_9ROSI|nr:hypothetical protein EZV62_027395 [Acer yangbiense]